MCGIAGYIGNQDATTKVFDMLKRLEYRGYDSAGIAVLDGGPGANSRLRVCKDQGKVDEVRKRCDLGESKVAMGQTRWATHGEPSQLNAHPHLDRSGKIAIVHNGIVENFEELKKELAGHKFSSQTDSEVIAHLIEDSMTRGEDSFEDAFLKALRRLEGSFAILAVHADSPDKILFARNESPLIVGLGKNENFLASDIPAILSDTKKCIILDDMEWGSITADGVEIRGIKTGQQIDKEAQEVDMDLAAAEKGGYDHFMLKEIIEEPTAVKNAMRGAEKMAEVTDAIKDHDKIYFVACGTAYHAGLVGKYILQEGGVPAFAEPASEFRYSTAKTLGPDSVLVLVSQSGETADTIAAAKEAKKRGARLVAVVNVVGSTLTRIADDVIYTYSGPEIAVASTKAYIGQLTSLTLLSLNLLKAKGMLPSADFESVLRNLEDIPSKIDQILDSRETIKETAELLEKTEDYFYIGRKLNLATALEGALKLKEISYLHAEAYPAGELKHGPLALMEEKVCVVAINPSDDLRKKMVSNIQEVRARKAKVIELTEGEDFAAGDGNITVPQTNDLLTPIMMIAPLHLLAYYIAAAKGLDIDKPRNLAKSVTVE